MKRRFLLILLASLAVATDPAIADTGTYELPEYEMILRPLEDGRTEITYHQKWLVKSGVIPWITVGTANDNFVFLDERAGGAARSIRDGSERGWSGVRIELDRDYQAGETFDVRFAIVQSGLFYEDPGGYRLDFIPGWYDRAAIGRMVVRLEFFGDLSAVKLDPAPTGRSSDSIHWLLEDVAPGARFRARATFPVNLFPEPISVRSGEPGGGGRSKNAALIVTAVVLPLLLVVVILIVWQRRGGGGYGGGGRVGIGGVGTGVHAGTHVAACACACVACACACACAGGGAAGCDRKLRSTCPLCQDCTRTDCPLHARHQRQHASV